MTVNKANLLNPVSTYRIQFSGEFGFKDLEKILEYLRELGIQSIYASPIFEATPGSTHGYDVVNPEKINPEIGSYYDFINARNKAAQLSLRWIQDIVPNHMAFSAMNPWIKDVLKKGEASDYSSYFDIDWNHPDQRLKGKIMLPFFGKSFDELITDRELEVQFKNNDFLLIYYDNEYPLNDESIPFILKNLATPDESEWPVNLIGTENTGTELTKWYVREHGSEFIIGRLQELKDNVEFMRELLELQYYRPSHWKESSHEINFRRFFTINDLIGLRMEDQEVFNEYHKLISELNERNLFQGVRVDHVDGLLKPGQYLKRLRSLLGDDRYIIVEKILEKDEELPVSWPIQGTSGYDFTSLLNNLFTNNNNEDKFNKLYEKWTGKDIPFEDLSYNKKSFILFNRMGGELDNLTRQCMKLDPGNEQEYMPDKMRSAIAEFLVQCPVYKIYRENLMLFNEQQEMISGIFERAFSEKPDLEKELNYLKSVCLDEKNEKYFNFFLKCMQYTGALMAKGLEDTVFYSYSRFLIHNEVGDSPEFFGIKRKTFHEEMIRRRDHFPFNMNSSSTHDSKRGEDFRARLAVISDIPGIWEKYVFHWKELNEKLKKNRNIPVRNDEYYIYQTIAGSYPIEGIHDDEYIERLNDYINKSVREAKDISSWAEPDETYENGVAEFVRQILQNDNFMKSFLEFHELITDHGLINSLSKVLLKITCPGVPDFYQGSEGWNFSFTDPDNRRKVDFEKFSSFLKEIKENSNLSFKTLWDERINAGIKLWLTQLCLQERNDTDEFFNNAEYIPLEIKGEYKKNVIAFMRKTNRYHYVIAVPLHLAEITGNQKYSPGAVNWSKTFINFPFKVPSHWKDILSGRDFKSGEELNLSNLFMDQPIVFLRGSEDKPERKAGILMHISSLPGKFGIGDIGPEAYKFIDFLKINRQNYWQILPLTRSNPESSFSPYSSLSAFAGNILFISPELLMEEGMIQSWEPLDNNFKNCERVCYEEASKYKDKILHDAWEKFLERKNSDFYEDFMEFCEKEAYWLNDYALFIHFKRLYDNKRWTEWPDEIKFRHKEIINRHKKDSEEELLEIKFYQYLFMKQWEMLRTYAMYNGIKIFGDIPIYVSFDSADVWANPELFRLDENLEMEVVAGVPPDYFNADGQLWNMPLYRWNVMKENNYRWWILRLKKNLELYDLLRIDHFRGFSKYWEVPGGEETAVYGKWVRGPADDFFDIIKREFPDMPFVAEDLGDIDQAVYDLRDQFELPGMHVVQFAFGKKMPDSIHIPHNHLPRNIVYSGTHDNNTVKGWFGDEMDAKSKKRLENYMGKKIRISDIHYEIIRLCFASPARLAIIPMQDWLGLGEDARMNMPSTSRGNWLWRLQSEDIKPEIEEKIKKFTKIYGRR